LLQAALGLQPQEDVDHSLEGDREIYLDVHGLTIEVIEHVEGSEASAEEQCVGNEVGRPDGFGEPRHV
jgi:hypothetical protein